MKRITTAVVSAAAVVSIAAAPAIAQESAANTETADTAVTAAAATPEKNEAAETAAPAENKPKSEKKAPASEPAPATKSEADKDSATEKPSATSAQTPATTADKDAKSEQKAPASEAESASGKNEARIVASVVANENGSYTLETERGKLIVPSAEQIKDLKNLKFDDEGLEVEDTKWDAERKVTTVLFNDGTSMDLPSQFPESTPWQHFGEVVEAYRSAELAVDTGAEEKVEDDAVEVGTPHDSEAAKENAEKGQGVNNPTAENTGSESGVTVVRSALATTGAKLWLIGVLAAVVIAAIVGAVIARKKREEKDEVEVVEGDVPAQDNDGLGGSHRV